jgi:hypothetical protein
MSIRPLRSFTVLLAPIFAIALAVPAMAQGFLSPPDASGPGVGDYTGFRVLYLINGVRIDTANGQETQILCTNVGTNAVNWAVQVFDGSAPGDLRCETITAQSIVVGEIEAFTTDSFADDFGLLGTCPDGDAGINVAVARVIADQKKAALMCTARVIDDATRNVVADLPVTPVGKSPKIKFK